MQATGSYVIRLMQCSSHARNLVNKITYKLDGSTVSTNVTKKDSRTCNIIEDCEQLAHPTTQAHQVHSSYQC